MPIPSADLRTNLGTWGVHPSQLPSVAHFMHDALPNEQYDPHFYGQKLKTHYFDTPHFDFRKARVEKDSYLTLRTRCYQARGLDEAYAISAKTEKEKFRVEIKEQVYEDLLNAADVRPILEFILPSNILDRMLQISQTRPIQLAVTVSAQRYAIEDDQDRYTLDTAVKTDLGKEMSFSVLEFKSADDKTPIPQALHALHLAPIKLSKFLWATKI